MPSIRTQDSARQEEFHAAPLKQTFKRNTGKRLHLRQDAPRVGLLRFQYRLLHKFRIGKSRNFRGPRTVQQVARVFRAGSASLGDP